MLDELPRLKHFLCCFSLSHGTIFTSIFGGLLAVVYVSICVSANLGLDYYKQSQFKICIFYAMFNYVVACIFAGIGWGNGFITRDKDARDLMLQLSIYFALGALLMHVVFVVCTMVICRRDCTSVIISHIGIVVILAVVMTYLILVTNSYRLSLRSLPPSDPKKADAEKRSTILLIAESTKDASSVRPTTLTSFSLETENKK